jgi:hypothetical protein
LAHHRQCAFPGAPVLETRFALLATIKSGLARADQRKRLVGAAPRLGVQALVTAKIVEPEPAILPEAAPPLVLTTMHIETVPANEAPAFLFELRNFGKKAPHYDAIAEALLGTRPGEWVRVMLTDLPTYESPDKLRTNVKCAMKVRRVGAVKTRVHEGYIWMTVVRETKIERADYSPK